LSGHRPHRLGQPHRMLEDMTARAHKPRRPGGIGGHCGAVAGIMA
jgi:hypothetical protein